MSEVEHENDQLGGSTFEEEGVPEERADLAQRLRNKRKAISDETEFFLEIQGYDGELVARYVKVDWDDFAKIGRAAEKSKNPRKVLLAQCDTLIKACGGIFFQEGGDAKKRVPLAQVAKEVVEGLEGFEEIKYDQNLAAYLGFESSSARQTLLGTFNNELAIGPHHNEVVEWMQSSKAEDDKDF